MFKKIKKIFSNEIVAISITRNMNGESKHKVFSEKDARGQVIVMSSLIRKILQDNVLPLGMIEIMIKSFKKETKYPLMHKETISTSWQDIKAIMLRKGIIKQIQGVSKDGGISINGSFPYGLLHIENKTMPKYTVQYSLTDYAIYWLAIVDHISMQESHNKLPLQINCITIGISILAVLIATITCGVTLLLIK